MEVKDNTKVGVSLDSTYKFGSDSKVTNHFEKSLKDIQERLQKSFESLPERNLKYLVIEDYIKDYPQSVIFVPHKDLNMFPILINEAKNMAKKYYINDENIKSIDQTMEHEFEHIKKCYELGVDFAGAGLVIFRKNDKPFFGGFILIPDNEDIDLKDNLRINLAPKVSSGSVGDYISSQKLIIDKLKKSKSFSNRQQIVSDTLLVIGERFKNFKDFFN